MWLLHSTVGNPWFYMAVVALLWMFLKKKITHVNISKIIKGYGLLFANRIEFAVFMMVSPTCLAIATNLIKLIDYNGLEIITVVLSILTSMLFTILTIVDNRMQVAEQCTDYSRSVRVKSVGNEMLVIINYEILLSVSLLIACFLAPLWQESNQAWFNCEIFFINGYVIISFFIYYLLYHFLLNLMIVLKRSFAISIH